MAFTQQELADAYKQMQKERADEGKLAKLAGQKLGQLIHRPALTYRASDPWHEYNARFSSNTSPYPTDFELFFSLCQYDDWNSILQALDNAGVKMQKSMVIGRGDVYNGKFDVSADPDFSSANQKVYRVTIDSYDAHESGY